MPEPVEKPSLHSYLRERYGSSTQKLVREHKRSYYTCTHGGHPLRLTLAVFAQEKKNEANPIIKYPLHASSAIAKETVYEYEICKKCMKNQK